MPTFDFTATEMPPSYAFDPTLSPEARAALAATLGGTAEAPATSAGGIASGSEGYVAPPGTGGAASAGAPATSSDTATTERMAQARRVLATGSAEPGMSLADANALYYSNATGGYGTRAATETPAAASTTPSLSSANAFETSANASVPANLQHYASESGANFVQDQIRRLLGSNAPTMSVGMYGGASQGPFTWAPMRGLRFNNTGDYMNLGEVAKWYSNQSPGMADFMLTQELVNRGLMNAPQGMTGGTGAGVGGGGTAVGAPAAYVQRAAAASPSAAITGWPDWVNRMPRQNIFSGMGGGGGMLTGWPTYGGGFGGGFGGYGGGYGGYGGGLGNYGGSYGGYANSTPMSMLGLINNLRMGGGYYPQSYPSTAGYNTYGRGFGGGYNVQRGPSGYTRWSPSSYITNRMLG